MEAVTHNLAGILIQLVCFTIFRFPFNLILTIIFAIGSHFILDLFANITYHTPEPHFHDKFWLIWHIFILILTVGSIVVFFIPFYIGMLAANLVDLIDWVILRSYYHIESSNNSEKPKKNFYIHNYLDGIRKRFLDWLPDWKRKKVAIISEVIIISLLFALIVILN